MTPAPDLVRSFGIRAYACHPIIAQDRVIGTLSFGTQSRGSFSDDDLALMKTVTDQVATAMEKIRAQQALQELNEQLEARVQQRTAELRQSMDLVEAERRRFKDVLDQLPAYLVLLTPDYHVSFANRFFEERFGRAEGQRCYEYLFNRPEPCADCESYKVLQTQAPQSLGVAGSGRPQLRHSRFSVYRCGRHAADPGSGPGHHRAHEGRRSPAAGQRL